VITWPAAQPQLDAGVIVLRQFLESDVQAITDACQDPEIPDFTRVPSPYDKQMALDFVRSCFFNHLDHLAFTYAIDYYGSDSTTPSFAGAVGLHSLQQSDHMAELGYWMEKSHRGKGIATLAVRTLVDYSINVMGFRRIEALTHLPNAASQKVLEKAGFTRDAILQNRATRPDGSQIDMVLFSMTDSRIRNAE
jgi:RimJ/RimL family protein N-acetyltransferase